MLLLQLLRHKVKYERDTHVLVLINVGSEEKKEVEGGGYT